MFNYTETYTIITRTFIYLMGKKLVFLFIYRNWTIWQYSITLFEIIIKFYSRRFNFFSTFWTNFKILGNLCFICDSYIINNNVLRKILIVNLNNLPNLFNIVSESEYSFQKVVLFRMFFNSFK